MYDPNHNKARFIATFNVAYRKNNATSVMQRFEPMERAKGSDLCTWSDDELAEALSSGQFNGIRSVSRQKTIQIIRAYIEWCQQHGVENVRKTPPKLDIAGEEVIRNRMVTSPRHLQVCLDGIFLPESEGTFSNVCRCYFWMAYAGLDKQDFLQIKKSDIDFDYMCVRFNDREYPIYREALPAIRQCLNLTGFVDERSITGRRKNRSNPIVNDRDNGEYIFATDKSHISQQDVRAISTRIATRLRMSRSDDPEVREREDKRQHISYERVALSGIFYRMYESELAGIPADFRGAAEDMASKVEYKESERMKRKYRIIENERYLLDDYIRWKQAFNLGSQFLDPPRGRATTRKRRVPIPIIVYRADNPREVVGEFESVSQASQELKIAHSMIVRCLNGDKKTSGSYLFERKQSE